MKKLLSNKSLLWGSIGIVVLVIGIVTALVLIPEEQDLRQEAAVPGGPASVTVNPASLSVAAGQTKPVKITFTTGGESIKTIAVLMSHTYEGTAPFAIENVQQSASLPNGWSCSPINSSDQNNTISVLALCTFNAIGGFSSAAPNQQIELLTFDVKGVSAGSGTLEFDHDETTISKVTTQADQATDVLNIPNDLAITVTGGTAGGGDISATCEERVVKRDGAVLQQNAVVNRGDILEYAITFTAPQDPDQMPEEGDPITARVIITDTLSSQLEYVEDSSSYPITDYFPDTNTVVLDYAGAESRPPRTKTFTYRVKVKDDASGTTVTNNSSVVTGRDQSTADNSCTSTFQLAATVDPGTGGPGTGGTDDTPDPAPDSDSNDEEEDKRLLMSYDGLSCTDNTFSVTAEAKEDDRVWQDVLVTFSYDGQQKTAYTNTSGKTSVEFTLAGSPTNKKVEASASGFDSGSIEVKAPTGCTTAASCNTVCSSTRDCSSGLTCVSGVCRDARCSTDSSCGCADVDVAAQQGTTQLPETGFDQTTTMAILGLLFLLGGGQLLWSYKSHR